MNKVRAIPEGFHTLAPHLVVRGGIKAIDFYQKAFGAKLVRKMLMPDSDLVMHAELQIGDSHLFLADEMPWPGVCPRSPQSLGGTSVTIHLWSENADATFEQATKAGAKVTMPLMDAFWGDRYGKLADPFGHEWSVGTHLKDLSPEEIERAGREAMANMKQ